MTGRRYAIYFSPPQSSPLDRLAAAWLGRDAHSGDLIPPEGLGGIGPAEQETMTEEPRHYGFHATLKPPFELREGQSEGELLKAAATFAATRRRFAVAGLQTARIGRFIALVPKQDCDGLNSLAADCVREFDLFRAPAGDRELARRRLRGLTVRQDELLVRWGYPYVMEEFRFHLTLTGPLSDKVSVSALETLSEAFDPICRALLWIDSISVFEQPDRQSPFGVLRRFDFGGV